MIIKSSPESAKGKIHMLLSLYCLFLQSVYQL